jgi:hypothetical protein
MSGNSKDALTAATTTSEPSILITWLALRRTGMSLGWFSFALRLREFAPNSPSVFRDVLAVTVVPLNFSVLACGVRLNDYHRRGSAVSNIKTATTPSNSHVVVPIVAGHRGHVAWTGITSGPLRLPLSRP